MTEEISFTLDKKNSQKLIDVNRKRVFVDVHGTFDGSHMYIFCKGKEDEYLDWRDPFIYEMASVYENRFEITSARFSHSKNGREIFQRCDQLIFSLQPAYEERKFECANLKIKLLLEDWK